MYIYLYCFRIYLFYSSDTNVYLRIHVYTIFYLYIHISPCLFFRFDDSIQLDSCIQCDDARFNSIPQHANDLHIWRSRGGGGAARWSWLVAIPDMNSIVELN